MGFMLLGLDNKLKLKFLCNPLSTLTVSGLNKVFYEMHRSFVLFNLYCFSFYQL